MRTTSSLLGSVPTNLAWVTASARFSIPEAALSQVGSTVWETKRCNNEVNLSILLTSQLTYQSIHAYTLTTLSHWILKMTSTQASVIYNNSPSKDYTHPEKCITSTYVVALLF